MRERWRRGERGGEMRRLWGVEYVFVGREREKEEEEREREREREREGKETNDGMRKLLNSSN